MKYISLVGFSLIILIVSSCKNNLDVFAPGKESISVYGILNPNEAVQNIRINKVYLTEGDALVAGQDGTQINYGPGELTVKLQRFSDANSTSPIVTTVGNFTKKEIILTETVVTTEGGTFNQNQRIWQTTDKLFKTGEYKLTVKNNISGAEFTSRTLVMDSVKPNNAMPFIYYAHPIPDLAYPMHGQYVTVGVPGTVTNKRAYIDYSGTNLTQKIKFSSITNAKLYSVVMRFHYYDFLTSGKDSSYVDYTFPTIQSSTLNGAEAMEVSFPTTDFFTNVGQVISRKNAQNVLYRKINYMEYIIYAGSESLSDFLQVNAPSTSIAQDKPYYTNIQGGVGLFSCRSRAIITKDLWSDFVDKIACHPSTHSLLFHNSSGATVPVPCN